MKVLVFGGTTEGRLLARELSALGAQVTVSVATALGAEELRGVPPLTVCVGRKDARQMREMLPGFAVCVDATHPYAAEASGNIRAACLAAGVPYRRLLRGASALPPDSVVVPDAPAAARWLAPRYYGDSVCRYLEALFSNSYTTLPTALSPENS